MLAASSVLAMQFWPFDDEERVFHGHPAGSAHSITHFLVTESADSDFRRSVLTKPLPEPLTGFVYT